MARPALAALLLLPTLAGAQSTAAPPAPVTAPAPVAAAVNAPEEERASWAVLKAGWFGTSADHQGESFSGSGEWEVAIGTGRVLGVELGGGSMTTDAGGLEVRTIPLLLTVRLAIPIAMVSPHLDVGAGVYFNHASLRDQGFDDTTAGWHAGAGCDVMLGRLVVGADLRYMGIAPTFSTIGKVTLDRYAALLKAGVRF